MRLSVWSGEGAAGVSQYLSLNLTPIEVKLDARPYAALPEVLLGGKWTCLIA